MVSRQLGIKKVQSSLQVLQVVLGWQGRLSQCGQDITLSSRSNGLVETRQGLYPRSRTWRTTSQGVLEMVRGNDLGVPVWGCGSRVGAVGVVAARQLEVLALEIPTCGSGSTFTS